MEKINIAELLKDCPKGMELDCTMWDNVNFDFLFGGTYPIKVQTPDGQISLNKYGCYSNTEHAKCVIFPKGKTTWEGFQRPWTIQDAKDGDVVSYGDGWTCIFKCIHGIWYSSYCFITSDGEFHTGYEEHEVNTTINGNVHPATKEQCNLFFQKIKEAGYKWNPETKTLEKLIEPYFKIGDRIRHKNDKTRIKYIDYIYYDSYALRDGHIIYFKEQDNYELVPNKFDITTLKPFDKVLVRDVNSQKWKVSFYSHYNKDNNYPFVTVGNNSSKCIPYNGNKHLLGTTNDCDDFYKTWEK